MWDLNLPFSKCSFHDLEITAVFIDDIMQQPDQVSDFIIHCTNNEVILTPASHPILA